MNMRGNRRWVAYVLASLVLEASGLAFKWLVDNAQQGTPQGFTVIGRSLMIIYMIAGLVILFFSGFIYFADRKKTAPIDE